MGILSTVLILFSATAWTAPPLFYVSTQGNDSWTGTLNMPNAEASDGPFLTVHRAQEALRASDTSQGAAVYIREGRYHLDRPLELGPLDSGNDQAPVR